MTFVAGKSFLAYFGSIGKRMVKHIFQLLLRGQVTKDPIDCGILLLKVFLHGHVGYREEVYQQVELLFCQPCFLAYLFH